jgi:hypothetical protein
MRILHLLNCIQDLSKTTKLIKLYIEDFIHNDNDFDTATLEEWFNHIKEIIKKIEGEL